MSSRKVGSGRSKATPMPLGWLSRRTMVSMDVKPCTAFVTCPALVARSMGRAKKARYTSELPSSRYSAPVSAMGRSYVAGVPPPPGALGGERAVDDLLRHLLHPHPAVHRR